MAKALNQRFYTDILYGSEVAAGSLRLESTLSATKGVVQIVGTSADLIISGQTGRLIHANSALRTYTFPDYSGTVLLSGIFTGANQFLYSTGVGTFTVLSAASASVLTTSIAGVPAWVTGSDGQFLQITGGVPVFAALPTSLATADASIGNTLPVYQSPGPGNHFVPLTTANNRVLISPSGTLTWGLITANYLSATGGSPLANGTSGQKLKSNGDGTFYWENDTSFINPGIQNRLSFYSAVTPGTELDDSSFLEVNEPGKYLSFLDNGRVRFYETTLNGLGYVELRAPASMGSPVSFALPGVDGSAGAFLVTDGFGNLSFVAVDNGSVANGLANQIAYYAVNGNDVSGLTTTVNRTLLSPAGVPTWGLITAPYLSAVGGVPLSNGTSNFVLISNGDGTFSWVSASSLVGSVNSGTANQAAYYAASGTSVSGSSFVDFINVSRRLDLKDNGTLRLYETTANGSDYVEFKTPTALAGSTSYTLPALDGLAGHALTTNGIGVLSWIEVGRGEVQPGAANTLAYYSGVDTAGGHGIVNDFPNVASRAMLTDGSNAINWALIKAPYLSSTGDVPLSNGLTNQVLVSDGSGNFNWVNVASIAGQVQSGTSGYLAYYPATGTSVDDSAFLFTNNAGSQLHIRNGGEIRFLEVSNTNHVGFRASSLTATNVVWSLPPADASSSGEVLVSNAAGVLSWQSQVEPGTVNALSFYASTDRNVEPASNLLYTGTALEALGASFSFLGTAGATPTAITVKSGNGVGVNGADLFMYAGVSDTLTHGSIILGVGVSDIIRISDLNPGFMLDILAEGSLRFFDALTNYVGFKAPNVVTTDTVWTLPPEDGSSNQVMVTDGSGTLTWASVAVGVSINLGTIGAFAYYQAVDTINDAQILIPVGLPATDYEALVVDQTGQSFYRELVTTGGSPGYVAFYTADQTVGYDPNFIFNGNLGLLEQTELRWYELAVNGSSYFALKAPASMATSIDLELPASSPLPGQTFVVNETADALVFQDPSGSKNLEQRGTVVVPAQASEVTVIFDESFTTAPKILHAQWSIVGAIGIGTLPTIGIKVVTSEAAVFKLSTTTLQSYIMHWQAYQNGLTQASASVYFIGGDDNGTLIDDLISLSMDADEIAASLASTLNQLRGYTTGTSSFTEGFILGGQVGLVSVDLITTFNYVTATVTDVAGTLSNIRSSAAGVGTRVFGYAVGGEEIGVGNLLTIDKVNHSTETAVAIAATLTDPAVGRAAANSSTFGYIVNSNVTSTVEILDFSDDTVTVGPNDFGTTNIVAGCNDNINSIGYFGKSNGDIYSYNFSTDTITSTGTSVAVTTSLSGAGNSLVNGYFSEDNSIWRFNFTTQTATEVNNLLATSAVESSVSTFQTSGLL